MPAIRSFIICTSPRSGSTFLCSLLRDTGVAGAPESYFHRPSLSDWRKGLNLPSTASLAEIVNAAVSAGTANTNLFGLRLQRESAPFLFDQLRALHPNASSDVDRLKKSFGSIRFIHLSRQDKVAQAVSLVRAQQSGLWHRNADGTERERTQESQPLVYDQTAIAAEVSSLSQQDADWQSWFETNDIHPMRVTYNDLSANPSSVLAKILSFLGVETGNLSNVEPATAKLADATSAAWVAQFLSDTGTG